jgi:hypothetical protein
MSLHTPCSLQWTGTPPEAVATGPGREDAVTRLIRGRSRCWLRLSVAAVMCAALAACGGGGEAANTTGSGEGAADEFCDRLFHALETSAQQFQDDGSDAEELFAAVVEGLREVRPHAPATLAADFDVLIEYYETAATGRATPEFAQRMEEFAASTNAVFSHCAMSPVVPPLG